MELRTARFILNKEKKPEDRRPAPDVPAAAARGGARVRHAKFGDGVVVSQKGDRLEVRFGKDVRVVLRQFLVPI